jgi:quinol-cytochrome oxidoreductase complex cytochrome b subunit
MKASQIAAKIVVRLFFILLLIALVPFLQGDTSKLQHLYLMPKHVYTLAFPILLIIGFITLLVICSIKKYRKADLNWLLVVNTLVLLAYAITLYIRIYQLIK